MTFVDGPDLCVLLTSNCLTIVGFWIGDTPTQQRWRDVILVLSCINIFSLFIILILDAYYSFGDMDDFMYVIASLLTVIFGVLKIIVMCWHKKDFFRLIDFLLEKIFKSNYDDYEQTIMQNCRRVSYLFVCCFIGGAIGTMINYALNPIIVNLGKTGADRVYPFKLWTDWVYVSPYFELLFVQQICAINQIGMFYFSFDSLLFVLNINVAGQFRILQYRFQALNKVNEMNNHSKSSSMKHHAAFKDCVRQHQTLIAFCKKLAQVFRMFSLIQILFFSLLICFVGYQILMADGTTLKRFIFICHIAGCLPQLFMFTYGCDCLIRESAGIATAIYSAPWTTLSMSKKGKMVRKDSLMVILRSQLPCTLSACGFASISLETCTKVLSTAMSYFTLLRQSAME